MQIPVYGSLVEWSDDGSAFTEILGAKGISIPEVSQDFNDVTSLNSPAGFKEYSKGMKDAGDISLSCFYSALLYAAAQAKADGATPTYFRLTFPAGEGQSTGDVFTWRAWVTPSVPSQDVGGDIMVELKQKVTAGVAWAAGAASV